MPMANLTRYEQHAVREIDLFKNPAQTWLTGAWEQVNKPLEWLGDRAFDNPVGATVAKAVHGVVSVINDGASWSVRSEAIYEEFRADGHCVRQGPDVRQLDLEHVDKTVGYLAAKYKLTAAAEGAATGSL